MRKNQKLNLKKGDTIQCSDLDELFKIIRQLSVERYDAAVDEKALLITINGKFDKDGNREAADE